MIIAVFSHFAIAIDERYCATVSNIQFYSKIKYTHSMHARYPPNLWGARHLNETVWKSTTHSIESSINLIKLCITLLLIMLKLITMIRFITKTNLFDWIAYKLRSHTKSIIYGAHVILDFAHVHRNNSKCCCCWFWCCYCTSTILCSFAVHALIISF